MESARWRAIIMFFVGSVYLYFDSINQVNTRRTTKDPNHRFSSDSLFSFVPHKDTETKSKHFEMATLTEVKKEIIKVPLSWRDRTKWESKLDKHEYPYLINPKRKCKDTGQGFETPRNITLLILVKSAPGNSKLRDAIRKTYMHRIEKRRLSCKVLFLLGVPREDDAKVQEITEEALTYGDILQEDFTDSYFNLTIKLVMGLKWASTFCPNANFIMSTDDDVMIDIDFLLEDLQTIIPEHRVNFVVGKQLLNGKPLRHKESKWYIPSDVYPQDEYPPFALGHGYVMSQDISKKAYHMSLEYAPPVPWDDVYFGMLLNKTGGVRIWKRNTWYMEKRTEHRKGEMVPQFDYLKIELSIEDMYKTWEAIESAGK